VIALLLALCLWGCSHRQVRSYEYCVVTDVTEKTLGGEAYAWVGHCDGGADIVFPRVIQKGDGIYFTSYTENNDTTTLHGYIKTIEEIVP
jgi:hypothetical protein